MHIWILWWSWRTGQEVIKEAINRWYAVTTLVRSPEKLDLAWIDQVTVIQWDATKQEDVQRLLDSWIDVLIHTISVSFFHKKPTHLYSSVTAAVIQAWWKAEHNCSHYIVMSSYGTHHGRKLPFPFYYGYEYFLWDVADDKESEEALLETSSLPWTVIKAVLLKDATTSSYQKTPFQEFVPSMTKKISRSAVAHALLDAAWDEKCFSKKIVVS